MDKRLKLFFIVLFFSTSHIFASDYLIEHKKNTSIYASISNKGLFLKIRFNKKIRIRTKHISPYLQKNKVYEVFLKTPRYGTYTKLPYLKLTDSYKRKIIKRCFTKDYYKNNIYFHKVKYSGIESYWRIAEWFTGNGKNYKKIKKYNKVKSNTLYKKAIIKIPESMLLKFLIPKTKQSVVEKENTPKNTKQPNSLLSYGKDEKGQFAIYKLKKGEALYSSVVVRFTGRLRAEDVMELAKVIAKRSNIKDVTDIKIGYPVKIPFDYLLPEYLPKDSKVFKEYEKELKAAEIAAQTEKIVKTDSLKGVYVILDAGHGGRDMGAYHNKVWEHDYVYDIVCRIKKIIETETKGTVLTTVYDKSSKYKVFEKKKLQKDRDEYIKTTPMFPLNSSTATTVGLNLRWLYSNYHIKRLIKQGVPRTSIVFSSFHADALYKKVYGTMAYIPSSRYYRKSITFTNKKYTRYKEVKQSPHYYYSKREMQLSEGLSRKFSKMFLVELKKQGGVIHKEKPIRQVIFRKKRSKPFVPAVIKYNKAIIRNLIEVANLKNKKDAKRLKSPKFRQLFARAYVNTLLKFYSKDNKNKINNNIKKQN
jgi:N-acetylmuramoyl-L-alanine amidase